MNPAREVADEIWFMQAGAVIERGMLLELGDRSDCPRLGEFLRVVGRA
jgi:polar amino acid transport system ATP-binding protein